MTQFIPAVLFSLFCGSSFAQTTGTAALYSDSATVPPLSVIRSVPGPLAKNLSTYPSFYEFSRSGSSEKGSIGALGSFEMNMSYNMDYTTGYHRFYDSTKAAYWLALNQSGFYLQYAPANTTGNDVWDASGNQYGFFFSVNAAQFNGNILPMRYATSNLGGPNNYGFVRLYIDSGTAPSAGNVTINKAAGRVFIGAGQQTLVLTDSYCTPNAHVFSNVSTADATASHAQVTPGAGACTVTLNAPATGQVGVDFFIVSVE